MQSRKYTYLLAKLDNLQALENKILVEKVGKIHSSKLPKLSGFSANSYYKAKNLIDQSNADLKENKYDLVFAKTYLAKRYLREVW